MLGSISHIQMIGFSQFEDSNPKESHKPTKFIADTRGICHLQVMLMIINRQKKC